jgi:hypothetical protein
MPYLNSHSIQRLWTVDHLTHLYLEEDVHNHILIEPIKFVFNTNNPLQPVVSGPSNPHPSTTPQRRTSDGPQDNTVAHTRGNLAGTSRPSPESRSP